MRPKLPRTVIVLGLVSLLNDAASEMIAPLLPVFLTTTLGAGAAVVGLVEGVAEATKSLLPVFVGRLADRGHDPKRLALAGYGLSNLARPLIGLAGAWGPVLGLRFLDRVGKGVRTAPRDGLLAAATAPHERGRAFGFHRSLDHAGAVLGPLLAMGLLGLGLSMQHVFLFSIVPGIGVVALLAFGLPATRGAVPVASPPRLTWRGLDRRLRALLIAAAGLALASPPEVFLVLWATDRGLPVWAVPLLWAAASAAKSLVAMPAGRLSDRLGRLTVCTAGWSLRVLTLLALALAGSAPVLVWGLVLLHSAGLALTEGAERALVGDAAAEGQRSTAYGLYHTTAGLLALPGAVLFGAVWQTWGDAAAFFLAAGLTSAAVVTLLLLVRPRRAA